MEKEESLESQLSEHEQIRESIQRTTEEIKELEEE